MILDEAPRVLVVAPHPDDECLGLGGTIARLTHSGALVDVLVIGCNTQPMLAGGKSDTVTRVDELRAACDELGVHEHTILWKDCPEALNPAAYTAALVSAIESHPVASIKQTRPDIMFIPNAQSHHQDHKAVHHAALAAIRPAGRLRHTPSIVLGYDGPEDAAWLAQGARRPWVVDTTAFHETKLRAISCHASQLLPAPHPRNTQMISVIDSANGIIVGATYAEAFDVYRAAWADVR